MNNILKKTSILLILVIILFTIVSNTYAVFREAYPITQKGSLYVIEMNITINKISNYGVFTTYIKPEGVYAYGIIIMKDPDNRYPVAYIMAGTQNEWYYYGKITSRELYLRIFIDYNLSKIIVTDNTCNKKEYSINYKPIIKYLYISIFNVTGRKYPQPDIDINMIRVYVSNNTLNDLNNTICAPKISPGILVINISNLSTTTTITTTTTPIQTTTTTTQTTSTTTISPQHETYHNSFLIFTTLLILVIIVIIGILLLTSKKRSPGP